MSILIAGYEGSKDKMSSTMKLAISKIERRIRETSGDAIRAFPNSLFYFRDPDGSEVLCSNYEDGSAGTVLNIKDREWYYRDSSGTDHIISGMPEVVANWHCHFFG